MKQRYFLQCSYKGTNYHGWQVQPNAVSVQEMLEKALSTLLREPVSVIGAGRTDTGVHASYFVLHFELEQAFSPQFDLVYKLNSFLPEDINEAAKILLEYTDFTSFSRLHTDVKTNNCKIYHALWTEENNQLTFEIKADRFLRNMVRAIVGTLLEVGKGKLSLEGFRQIIERKDRSAAGASAPAKGLFLVDIEYPKTMMPE